MLATWLCSFVLAGDYVEHSPLTINCLKSWWLFLIVTAECGAELFPCSYYPQNIKYSTILLHHITLQLFY